MVELPKYSGSCPDSLDSQESVDVKEKEKKKEKDESGLKVSEKELPALPEGRKKGADYYDDASDEEEGQGRGLGVARTSSKRVEHWSRKL